MLTGPELQKIFGFDAPANSEFGYSVDIEGDWAVIGAPMAYTMEDPHTGRRIEPVQTGAVYVYHLDGNEWDLEYKLTPYQFEEAANGGFKLTAMEPGTQFGSSVSLKTISGVGYSYPLYVGVGAAGVDMAFAYTPVDYHTTSPDQLFHSLGKPFYQNSFGGAEESFGTSVSIAENDDYLGGTLVVGCPHCETEEGRIDIVEYSVIRFYDPEVTSFIGCEMPFCNLGAKVILKGDTAVASAPAVLPGGETVVVFKETDGVWTREVELTSALVEHQDSFAANVALSGDTILVSDYSSAEVLGPVGNIYEFTRTDGVWSETGVIYASDFGGVALGNALDLSGDIAVTSDAEGNVIGLYRTGGTWVELARDAVAPADESIKEFLGVDADSGYTIIGAPEDFDGGENAGAAYFVDMTYIQ